MFKYSNNVLLALAVTDAHRRHKHSPRQCEALAGNHRRPTGVADLDHLPAEALPARQ